MQRARRHLALDLGAHLRRGARDGHPAAPRLVEVGREAERDRAEVAPELGEVRVPDRVVGAAERHRRVLGRAHHHVAAHPEPRSRRVAVLALPHLAVALEERRRHLGSQVGDDVDPVGGRPLRARGVPEPVPERRVRLLERLQDHRDFSEDVLWLPDGRARRSSGPAARSRASPGRCPRSRGGGDRRRPSRRARSRAPPRSRTGPARGDRACTPPRSAGAGCRAAGSRRRARGGCAGCAGWPRPGRCPAWAPGRAASRGARPGGRSRSRPRRTSRAAGAGARRSRPPARPGGRGGRRCPGPCALPGPPGPAWPVWWRDRQVGYHGAVFQRDPRGGAERSQRDGL